MKNCYVIRKGNTVIGVYECRWDALHKMLMLTHGSAMRAILRESCNRFLPTFGVGDLFAELFKVE